MAANDSAAQTGADNIATNVLTTVNGTAVTGIEAQRIKVGYGDDGSYRDISPTFPMPTMHVDVANTGTITAADVASVSSTGAGNQSLLSGTPTAGSTVAANVDGMSSFAVQVTGTFVATYAIERSLDNGVNWTVIGAFAAGTNVTGQSWTSPGMFHGNASSCTNIRVRCTAFTSGSLSVRVMEGAGTGTITVGNPIRLYDVVSGVQGTIKAGSTASVAADTALVVGLHPSSPLPAGTNNVGTFTSRIDTGRTTVNMYASAVTAGATATEALVSLTISRGTAATTTGTTFAITAGKTLRITGIRFQHIGHATATAATMTWRLRLNTAGAVALTSTPILIQARTQTPATSLAKDAYDVPIGEGMDIVNPTGGTVNIGFTVTPTFTTNAPTYDLHVIGFEF